MINQLGKKRIVIGVMPRGIVDASKPSSPKTPNKEQEERVKGPEAYHSDFNEPHRKEEE